MAVPVPVTAATPPAALNTFPRHVPAACNPGGRGRDPFWSESEPGRALLLVLAQQMLSVRR